MKIEEILEQTITGMGYELVDVEITPAKIIRAFVETKDKLDEEGKIIGLSIDDCVEISNQLSRVLVVEEIDYNRLEISSPGLERPLKKLSDYTRFNGRVAKIKTFEIIDDNEKVFQGVIGAVDGEKISIKVSEEKTIVVNFDNIARARLIFELPNNKNKKTKK